MKQISVLLLFLLLAYTLNLSAQSTYYVDYSGGLDTNPGTIDQPFKTINQGLSALGSTIGTIYLRGGNHFSTVKISISKTGQPNNYVNVWAYPGETPVVDFTGIAANTDGFSVSGSYCHLKGLEIINATHNGIRISGHYNIIENCLLHSNGNTGLHMGSSSTADNPSNNLVLNCDSYFNFDPPIGGNADGFSAKWNVGLGNVFKGCRSFNNSDDGWDLWMCIAPITIDSCFAFRNGVDIWHTGSVNGNGNGFKLGGSNVATPHLVRNCLSFDNAGNAGKGFDENNNLAGQTLFNCTSYRNKGANYSFPNTVISGQHLIQNCISYIGTVNITSGLQDHNSWPGFTVSNTDFVSIDTAQARAPRNFDGSLPDMTFMYLAPGSQFINAGTNVGLPYYGSAPDLGAFEYIPPLPVELTIFECRVENTNVTLAWKTATEGNCYGFEVERRITGDPLSNTPWKKIGFIYGAGTSNAPHEYTFIDKTIPAGHSMYRLKQIDDDGSFTYTQSIEIEVGALPQVFALEQNYPNPFNPTTQLRFSVQERGMTTLKVYDILGQEVAILYQDYAESGTTITVQFDASRFTSGTYFSILQSGSQRTARKMVLVK